MFLGSCLFAVVCLLLAMGSRKCRCVFGVICFGFGHVASLIGVAVLAVCLKLLLAFGFGAFHVLWCGMYVAFIKSIGMTDVGLLFA